MIQAAAIAEAVGLVTKVLHDTVESPDTYKRLDGLRAFVSKVTGKEVDKAGFLALLEQATQGDPYTGEWEQINDDTRRLRVEGGWIFDIGRGNPIHVRDK